MSRLNEKGFPRKRLLKCKKCNFTTKFEEGLAIHKSVHRNNESKERFNSERYNFQT